MRPRRSRPPVDLGGSAFSGYRFPPEVIVLAVRWYLRYGLSYRDLEELLAERGVEVAVALSDRVRSRRDSNNATVPADLTEQDHEAHVAAIDSGRVEAIDDID
jgi:transposase-like protein